jgi:hypothetical protein
MTDTSESIISQLLSAPFSLSPLEIGSLSEDELILLPSLVDERCNQCTDCLFIHLTNTDPVHERRRRWSRFLQSSFFPRLRVPVVFLVVVV